MRQTRRTRARRGLSEAAERACCGLAGGANLSCSSWPGVRGGLGRRSETRSRESGTKVAQDRQGYDGAFVVECLSVDPSEVCVDRSSWLGRLTVGSECRHRRSSR